MRRMTVGSLLALVLCGVLTGCDATTCEQAVTKLEGECGLGTGVSVPNTGGSHECIDDKDQGIFAECSAGCILDYACEDITDKDQSAKNNPYIRCLGDCQK